MNVTLILDGVAEKIDVRKASSEKELLLQDNEDIRIQIWTHLYPVILGALIFYIFLSISWLLYNIQSYRRQKKEYNRLIENRQLESSRRREFYKRIPMVNEEVELVEPQQMDQLTVP
ncbi:hypothetical protein M3Y98_00897500 [Aphelenchoides besseyi]|nr:hypothetical protein M3Y98_00897500 [Aphelenchoides besseyi]KAI6193055.1 hypothetical protein M3Y96_00977600 [Aphelenchoides besseyi]